MAHEHADPVFLDELATLSGLPRAVLDELVACGALPMRASSRHEVALETVALARAAGRLREHFELDGSGVAVAVTLLRRVRVLEARVVELRARTFVRD